MRPILVLNDEGHHAWRPKPAENGSVPGPGDVAKEVEAEVEEATVWVNGLDTINRAAGIRCCVDLSATPFYLGGSGYIEGAPFPWLVSDFGLVDAIESGIVKIPRLPVSDTTGRPEPKYFRLWQHITEDLQPGERLPGRGAQAQAGGRLSRGRAGPAAPWPGSGWSASATSSRPPTRRTRRRPC